MKIIQKNKKAYFDYEILEELTAGLILTGSEVKSVRAGNINLKGSYVSIKNNRVFVKGLHISKYPYDQREDHEPLRDKELLLNKKELNKIQAQLNTIGISVIPLFIGLQGAYIKIKVGLARGKKKHDKRHSIKQKDDKRKMGRLIKNYL